MVRQAYHEQIMSGLKFSHLAVRPEPVEGRLGDFDTIPDGGRRGWGDCGQDFGPSWSDHERTDPEKTNVKPPGNSYFPSEAFRLRPFCDLR